MLGENVEASLDDQPFTARDLEFDWWSSEIIPVSREFLMDTAVEDAMEEINGMTAERIGRGQAFAMTQKPTASTVPTATTLGNPRNNGILDDTTEEFTGVAGSVTKWGWNLVTGIRSTLNRAYRSGAVFMMNSTGERFILNVLDNNNRPLWTASLQEGEPGRIINTPYIINDDMPSPGVNVTGSLLYGQLRNFRVFDATGTEMLRFNDSGYAAKRQVGFLAFQRTGYRLIDGGDSTVKLKLGAS